MAVVLVAVLVVILTDKPDGPGPRPTADPTSDCNGRMLRTETDECVGVVENVNAVDEDYRDIVRKIFKHNEEVAAAGGQYVKIVLLTPMSGSKTGLSGTVPAHAKGSLEGAYTALHRANNDSAAPFGDPNLFKVQMVPANFGSRQKYSDQLRDAILASGEPSHPIVAVVGLGSSLPGTMQMTQELSSRHIPMVSAVASADILNSKTYPGLYSVSPSSSDYVLALRKLLDAKLSDLTFGKGSALVVADQNKNEDPFVLSLLTAFERYLDYYVGGRDPQWFSGGTVETRVSANVFQPIVDRICGGARDNEAPLQMVFYAGRLADFEVFAERLKGRECIRKPLAVLVGATGFQVAATYRKKLLDPAKVTVIYSTSTDPVAWGKGRNGKPEGFDSFAAEFRRLGFDDASFDDGYAIMYHDAVASVIQAARQAVPESDDVRIPEPDDVSVQLKNVRVTGASGTFSFPDSTLGRAKGKVVPCRQIGSTTPFQLPSDLGSHLYYTGE